MLNEREIGGSIIRIERAHFNQKADEYVPREGKKANKVAKVLVKKNLQKQFNWGEGDEEGDGFKIVILRNMFSL